MIDDIELETMDDKQEIEERRLQSLSMDIPECKGFRYWTDYGYEYDCGYDTGITCEDCLAGFILHGGTKDPRIE